MVTVTLLLCALLAVPLLPGLAPDVQAQVARTDEAEYDDFLIIFSYPAAGRLYLSARYDYRQDRLLLPVVELFDILEINVRRGDAHHLLKGLFLVGGEPWKMDFLEYTVTLSGQTREYDADQMRTGETDFYLSPEVFAEVFDMEFTINMGTLTLAMETPHIMPVEDRLRRQRSIRRLKEEGAQIRIDREFHDETPRYGRDHSVLSAGFLDYNLGVVSRADQLQQNYNYQFTGGAEVLGGDLQGSHVGGYTADGKWFNRTSNFRWRYVPAHNHLLTRIEAGQLSTGGLSPAAVTGITLSNEPIEPRRAHGTYVVDGRTEPDSEVEIYFNNRLIAYTTADALGYYRFDVPMRYGTTNLRTQVYTPDGDLRINEQQIQIPFTFLPRGVAAYNLTGGQADATFQTGGDLLRAGHGNIGYGLSNWLTARIGLDYNEFDTEGPFVYGATSMRLFGQYLLNTDIAPGAFYRARTSVMFPSSRRLSVNYTWFDGESRFNRQNANQQMSAHIYTPVPLPYLNVGFRLGSDMTVYDTRTETRYTSDLFTRVGQLNRRFNYRDVLNYTGGDFIFGRGDLTASATYSLSRNGRMPTPLRGTFVRFSTIYSRQIEAFRQVNLQLSRSVMGTGRFTLGVARQLQSGVTTVQAGLNFNPGRRTRSSSDYRGTAGHHTFRQSLRGSAGYDNHFNHFQFTDRQQVGRGAASVLLFVDNNNSGTFDEGDEILPYNAIRVDRAASARISSDGVVRLTQMQSYYRYNMEVNRMAIPDPTLVPAVDKFSFISDPNQYKLIEIPFYRSGTIDGTVYHEKENGQKEGTGGLRLQLTGLDSDFSKQIRTFYGGGFYAMDIPPGRYTLEVDPAQLDFMGVVARDGNRVFEIRPVATGDYLGDMEIILVPAVDEPEEKPEELLAMDEFEKQLHREYQSHLNQALRLFVEAQMAVYDDRLDRAMSLLNQSLKLYETAAALALKGSVYLLLDNPEQAETYWERAIRLDSDIRILQRFDLSGL